MEDGLRINPTWIDSFKTFRGKLIKKAAPFLLHPGSKFPDSFCSWISHDWVSDLTVPPSTSPSREESILPPQRSLAWEIFAFLHN